MTPSTGKERDTESGLDYFGARYYASNMGRFMSPDWSANAQAVPYAKLDDPQSLNLYGYVRNNPLSRTDPDGHCDIDGEHHGGVWCFFHALGAVQTQHEQANDLRVAWSNRSIVGADGKLQPVSSLSDKDIINLDKQNRYGGVVMAGIGAGSGIFVGVGASKLAHIYDKHSGDFGLMGNKNSEQLDKLEQALQEHVNDPDTKAINGQYRGNDSTIYLNLRTSNVVVTDANGQVTAAFKASPAQVNYINTTGRLN